MSPVVKYTLVRLGLFLVVAAVLVPIPMGISLLLKLMIAILISAGLSFVLLKGMRNQVAQQMLGASRRREDEKARLRAALAGEDGADDEDDDADADGARRRDT